MNMGLWKLCEYGVVIHSWFAFTQHITCIRIALANHLYPKKRHDPTGRGKMSPKYDVIWLRWVLYTSPKSTWAIKNSNMKVNVSFMKANQLFQNETKLEMSCIRNSKGKKVNKVIYFNSTELHAWNLFLITHLKRLGWFHKHFFSPTGVNTDLLYHLSVCIYPGGSFV